MFDEAYDELRAATPRGWEVKRPSFHSERNEWQMYAFRPAERRKVGRRKDEGTAIAPTEERVIRSMA